MRRMIVVIALALAIVGSALAAPKKGRPHKKTPAAAKGSGSGSAGSDAGSGSGSGSAAVEPTPPPAPAPPSPAPAAPAEGSAAAPVVAPAPTPATAPSSLAMRPKAQHDGFVDDMDCKACHTSAGWEIGQKAGASGFDHDRTGFPLRGAHTQTTCTQCHSSTKKLPTMCEGCHRDPHQGRQGSACAECHSAVAWNDTNTLEQHRRTRMPLTGRHAVIDCVACHKRQSERTWSDVPVDCYACHRAEYHRTDVHPTHDGSGGQPMFPRDCALCHQTSAWSPAFTDPNNLPRNALARTDHDVYFVLSIGSHRGANCASCHEDQRRPQLARCDGCHQDLVLRKQHRGTTIARNAASCLRCHPRGAAR